MSDVFQRLDPQTIGRLLVLVCIGLLLTSTVQAQTRKSLERDENISVFSYTRIQGGTKTTGQLQATASQKKYHYTLARNFSEF